MVDISKCNTQSCPSRLECYRFTAPAGPMRQSYSDFDAVRNGANVCEYFIPVSAVLERDSGGN